MNKLCYVLLMLLSFHAVAQTDSAVILYNELPEMICTPRKSSANQYSIFALSKYRSHVASSIRCGENIAIMIPQAAQTAIYLEEIVIPIRKINLDYPKPDYDYFLLYKQNGKDTLIAIKPLKQMYSSKSLKLIVEKYFYTENAVSNFTFILKPRCDSNDKVVSDIFKFTFKFRSRLTYEWKNNKLQLVNFQNRDKTIFNPEKKLNWQVDVKYRVE